MPIIRTSIKHIYLRINSSYVSVTMTIFVLSGRGEKAKKTELKVSLSSTIKDVKKEFARASKKSIHRLSFKVGEGKDAIRLDSDEKTLESYNLKDGSEITFKDLGAQINYRLVFLLEYFGPMVFVLLYSIRPALIYGADAAAAAYDPVARLGVICWTLHFLKREYETLFVHKFSRATMPLSNLFKNCVYYWTFGAVIGYPLSSPSYVAPAEMQVNIGLGIFALSEIGNLICHLMLSNLRPAEGSQKRTIPSGFLFDFVACPNYTFEVFSWVGFSILTNIPYAYLFTLVGFLQMADWAQKKHKGYKKTYDKEYTKLKRKAIIPFLY
jgi:very-long-chain enoyl-CoA reductase